MKRVVVLFFSFFILVSLSTSLQTYIPESASADDVYGSTYSPSKVFDGSKSTGWFTKQNPDYPVNLSLDFGEVVEMNGFNIYPLGYYVPISFKLYGSSDNENWVTLLSDATMSEGNTFNVYSFEKTKLRYIMIEEYSTNNNYYAGAIYEVEGTLNESDQDDESIDCKNLLEEITAYLNEYGSEGECAENYNLTLDTNKDGFISPVDALIVANRYNKSESCDDLYKNQTDPCLVEDDCDDGEDNDGDGDVDCDDSDCEESESCSFGCRDSDGGLNISSKGVLRFNGSTKTDECLDRNTLIEHYCEDEVPGQKEFECFSNGGLVCEDGRCIREDCSSDSQCEGLKESYCYSDTRVCTETYKRECVDGYCKSLSASSACGNCMDGCSEGECVKKSYPARDIDGCSGFMDFLKRPYSFKAGDESGVWKLEWNRSYDSSYSRSKYRYNVTSASFSYDLDHDERRIVGVWAEYGYHAYEFEGESPDLDDYISSMNNPFLCETMQEYKADGQYFYVCQRAFSGDDRDYGDYDYGSGVILWSNSASNIIYLVDMSYMRKKGSVSRSESGSVSEIDSLVDEFFSMHRKEMEGQKEIEKKLDSIIDNEANRGMGSFSYYSMPDVVLHLFVDDLNNCPSDLTREDSCYSEWRCITEPSVCPEHGYQTRRCEDLNGCRESKEMQVQCNPGICSGCLTYKDPFNTWRRMDTKCMPYGARFEHDELGDIEKVHTTSERDNTSLFEVVIENDRLAYIHYYDEIQGINETTRLVEGSSANLDYMTEITNRPLKVVVRNIQYYPENEEKSYVEFENVESYDAYCGYDGDIKEQKGRLPNGNWAGCQNHFECESNFCSSGVCIEVRDIIRELSGFEEIGVRILCRFAGLFGVQRYEKCILENLGDTSSSSEGGEPPKMPS